MAFLVINLVTQGVLNFFLSASGSDSYWLLTLFVLEVMIFIVETAAFIIATRITKEHKWWRALLYVITANAASLILGAIILSFLPI
jgi:hypothetical protein